MSDRVFKQSCPRCGRMLTVVYPQSEAQCICHLYCNEGSKPSDCNAVPAESVGGVGGKNAVIQLGYPFGIETNQVTGSGDRLHAESYCTVHGNYIYNDVVEVVVDWDEWFKTRIPVGERRSYWKVT